MAHRSARVAALFSSATEAENEEPRHEENREIKESEYEVWHEDIQKAIKSTTDLSTPVHYRKVRESVERAERER